jgi:hypothetical protein
MGFCSCGEEGTPEELGVSAAFLACNITTSGSGFDCCCELKSTL